MVIFSTGSEVLPWQIFRLLVDACYPGWTIIDITYMAKRTFLELNHSGFTCYSRLSGFPVHQKSEVMNLRIILLIRTFFGNHFYHNISEQKCKQILVIEFKLFRRNFFSHKKIFYSISLFSLDDCTRIPAPETSLYALKINAL